VKRCTQTHDVTAFGTIPEGSLWDDDSPYLEHPDLFEDVADEPAAEEAVPVVRKFGTKKAAAPRKVD
jgi:hypothetical protein